MKLLKQGDVFIVELDGSDRLEKGIVNYITSQFGLTSTAVGNGLEHQWDGTKLRIKNPDGTWGEWVNLRGEMGETGFDGVNGNDGWDGQDGIDGDIPEATLSINAIVYGVEEEIVEKTLHDQLTKQFPEYRGK